MIVASSVSPALKIGLQALGVWPNMPHSTFYWLIFMSSIVIVQYFQYLYIFSHFKFNELSNLVDGLSLTLDYTLTFFKVGSLWVHRRVLYKILVAMDNDWCECIDVDQHLYVMTVKANISQFCSNAMLSFNAIAGVFYLLGNYVIRFVYIVKGYNDTLRQYPIKIQFPFEPEQSIFAMLVVTLFLHVMLNASTIAILNGLMITLVLHVSGQIDIICQELKNISANTSLLPSASALGILIERHNRIISFSDNIEKLFSFIGLMQVVCNTIVICCLGSFIIITVHYEPDLFVLAKTAGAYVALMTESFIVCFAGEYLTLKGKSIADAAYETLWYDMPSNYGKIITFMIMRSQKRLVITAGKMMDMSFEAFTTIMKASASYISVLNAMYRY